MKQNIYKLLLAGVAIAASSSAFGQTAVNWYDSTLQSGIQNGSFLPVVDGQSYGNQIQIYPGGDGSPNWALQYFTIQYYTTFTTAELTAAGTGIDITLYNNDGTPYTPIGGGSFPTPGTVIWDTGFSTGLYGVDLGGNFQNVSYYATDGSSPADWPSGTGPAYPTFTTQFTFAVTFTNLPPSVDGYIALPLANSVGPASLATFGTFWESNSGSWSLNQIDSGATPANLAVIFNGVPEPSVFGLSAVGGLLAWGASRLKRNRKS